MKSERRHELETNELAVQLQEGFEKVNPYLGQIIGVVAAIAILAAIWTYWSGNTSVAEGKAWEEYMLASYSSDRELMDMKRLADNEDYKATGVAEWAYLTWSDRQLLLASQAYLVSREAALSRLETIEGIYKTLSADATDPVLKNRAQYGLAQVYEMQDKIEEARQAYNKVSGDLAMLAAERAKQLENADVESAITWLASASLPKVSLPDSLSGGGTRPSFEADIPMGTSNTQDIPLDKSLEEILSGTGTDENRYDEANTGSEESASKGDDAADNSESTESSAPAETEVDTSIPKSE